MKVCSLGSGCDFVFCIVHWLSRFWNIALMFRSFLPQEVIRLFSACKFTILNSKSYSFFIFKLCELTTWCCEITRTMHLIINFQKSQPSRILILIFAQGSASATHVINIDWSIFWSRHCKHWWELVFQQKILLLCTSSLEQC